LAGGGEGGGDRRPRGRGADFAIPSVLDLPRLFPELWVGRDGGNGWRVPACLLVEIAARGSSNTQGRGPPGSIISSHRISVFLNGWEWLGPGLGPADQIQYFPVTRKQSSVHNQRPCGGNPRSQIPSPGGASPIPVPIPSRPREA